MGTKKQRLRAPLDTRIYFRYAIPPDERQAEIDRRVFWQQPLPVALAQLERMAPQEARYYVTGEAG